MFENNRLNHDVAPLLGAQFCRDKSLTVPEKARTTNGCAEYVLEMFSEQGRGWGDDWRVFVDDWTFEFNGPGVGKPSNPQPNITQTVCLVPGKTYYPFACGGTNPSAVNDPLLV